jgi:hypothetical protein
MIVRQSPKTRCTSTYLQLARTGKVRVNCCFRGSQGHLASKRASGIVAAKMSIHDLSKVKEEEQDAYHSFN